MFSKFNITKSSAVLLFGSVTLGGLGGYIAYKHFSNKTLQNKKSSNLTPEQLDLTLKILRDLRTQLFPLYPTILTLRTQLFQRSIIQAEQYRKQYEAVIQAGGPQAEQLKEQLRLQGQEIQIGEPVDQAVIAQQIKSALKPEVINIVESKQNMVVKKFKCTIEELKEWIAQCNDQRIRDIQMEIFDSIEKSLEGKDIPIILDKNDWKLLTKEKCLEVTKQILLNAGIKLRNMFAEIRSDEKINFGEISLADNQVINKIADLRLVDEKTRIIIEEGLDKLKEQDYAFALAKACQKHKKNDEVFAAKLDLLDKIHENVMDICMSTDRQIISEKCIIDLYQGNLDIDVLIEQAKKQKEEEKAHEKENEEKENEENEEKENEENFEDEQDQSDHEQIQNNKLLDFGYIQDPNITKEKETQEN